MVTFGSSDLCLYFCVAVYTQYARMCVQVQNTNVLLMNLLASESITVKKNETHALNYIVFKNIHSGNEMTILAILISDYESLCLLTRHANSERDISCD